MLATTPYAAEVLSPFAQTILLNKEYSHKTHGGGRESWDDICERVTSTVMGAYLPELAPKVKQLMLERKFIPGGRYLYASGRRYPQVNSCFLFRAQDSREGWADILSKSANALMTGGGIGVVYSDVRGKDTPILGMGGTSTGPCALMAMVNESARYIIQGGSRRSAVWAGLQWDHPDIFLFIGQKKWSDLIRHCKKQDFLFPAPMDGTNISVILNSDFFDAYPHSQHPKHALAQSVYQAVIRGMLQDGEPGFSVDIGDNEGDNCRNACTEVTSSDDSDMCNLGALSMGRFKGPTALEDFREAISLGIAFLLCGTLYSKLPLEQMYRVREKNRRLGLGLMGAHEWMLQRGIPYGPDSTLAQWMQAYALSGNYANLYADKLGISRPIATRSIAPTGTISIIGETTSGAEPIFAAAYKRRYLEGSDLMAQYVADPVAQRLVSSSTIDPNQIEDAMTLAEDVERRIKFQSWMQGYVDHGISSTINLPEWGSSINNESTISNFGKTLFKYLPTLRGITAYPNGSRDGQPLTRVPYTEAIQHLGVEFRDGMEHNCKSGVCSG